MKPLFSLFVWAPVSALGLVFVRLGWSFTMDAEQVRAIGVVLALVLVPVGLFFVAYVTTSFFGRRRIVLDDTVFEYDLHLGPIHLRRKLVPLARLLKIESKTFRDTGPTLEVKTSTEEFEFDLPDLNGDGPATARDLLLEVRTGLERMGRRLRLNGIDGAGREAAPSQPESSEAMPARS